MKGFHRRNTVNNKKLLIYYRSLFDVSINRVKMATTAIQMNTPLNPRPFINELVGKKILIRLKWGITYTGKQNIMRSFI